LRPEKLVLDQHIISNWTGMTNYGFSARVYHTKDNFEKFQWGDEMIKNTYTTDKNGFGMKDKNFKNFFESNVPRDCEIAVQIDGKLLTNIE
jgi:hypothetical protein